MRASPFGPTAVFRRLTSLSGQWTRSLTTPRRADYTSGRLAKIVAILYPCPRLRGRRSAAISIDQSFKRFRHVAAMRSDRQDRAGRPQGEPLQPQDQAAVPAQSAERHDDLGRARPLGASCGSRPTRSRPSIIAAGSMPSCSRPRTTSCRRGARAQAADRKKKTLAAPPGRQSPALQVRVQRLADFDQGSASVNCSSSVRCRSEKLSSEISVSTISPPALRWTLKPSILSIS